MLKKEKERQKSVLERHSFSHACFYQPVKLSMGFIKSTVARTDAVQMLYDPVVSQALGRSNYIN